MPKKPVKESPHKLRPDVAETAYRVMMEATGQTEKTVPPHDRTKEQRNPEAARAFMKDVAARLANRVQLTTDGQPMYLTAVERAFGYNKVDDAVLVKTYGQPTDDARRYRPPECTGAIKERIMGEPVDELISTSYVERVNLSMRMQMRRFTRLTNAFSKKAENHAHAVSLYSMFYNFCRVHQTLTKAANGILTTPAMAAGLADHVWKVEEIVSALDPTKPIAASL